MKMGRILAMMLIFVASCAQQSALEPSWLEDVYVSNDEFKLYSENEGIYPDKSVLDDPNNPFADKYISDDFKWKVASLGSEYAATRFYLWATVLAHQPWGEPQFYTAEALRELAQIKNSDKLREQAIKAYKAVLEYFPYDKTDLTGHGDFYTLGIMALEKLQQLGESSDKYMIVEDANGNKALVKK